MKIKNVELYKTYYLPEKIISEQNNLPKAVFLGRSNVGKSSLINFLVNRKNLAKTSSKPGKTVSINYYRVNAEFYFVDLPGFGYAKIPKIERKRVSQLISAFIYNVSMIKIVILLLDCRRDFKELEIEFIQMLVEKDIKILTVITKSDKLNKSSLRKKIELINKQHGIRVIPFTVRSQKNKEALLKLIGEGLKE
jgi:GTP-binding protein